MSKILPKDWSADFAMDGEHEKSRMKEATSELASFISSLNLGSKELPIEENVQLAEEKIDDVEYNMVELVDLAWIKIIHLGLDLSGEPMEGNDVDDRPTPIVKLPRAREYAQILSNFVVEHLSEFLVIDVMNMQSFMDNLSKMSISNINKHYRR